MKRLIFSLLCLASFNIYSQNDEFMATYIEDKEAFLSSKTGEFVFREHDKTDASQLRTKDDGTVIYTDINSHTVKKGETLSVISKKYGVSVNEIKKQNKLKNNNLSIGQQLQIKKNYIVESSKPIVKQAEGRIIARLAPGQTPGGMTPPDLPPDAMPGNTINLVTDNAKPTPVSFEASVSTKNINEDGSIIHTVKSGETLFSIARKYKISLEDLKKENNLALNTINAGQKLKIKVYDPQVFQQNLKNTNKVNTSSASEKLQVAQEQTNLVKEVKTETFKENVEKQEAISKKEEKVNTLIEKYSDKTTETKKNDVNKDRIEVEQTVVNTKETKKESRVDELIKKYSKQEGDASKSESSKTTHTVKKGETLWGISKKYQLTVIQLIELNSLKTNTLDIGQKLKIK